MKRTLVKASGEKREKFYLEKFKSLSMEQKKKVLNEMLKKLT